MTTLLVTGSRSLSRVSVARTYVIGIVVDACEHDATTLVHGCAQGPDLWALAAAHECSVPVRVFYARYYIDPLARNRAMVAWASKQPSPRCLAFIDTASRTHGAAYTVRLASKAGMPCEVHTWDGENWSVKR